MGPGIGKRAIGFSVWAGISCLALNLFWAGVLFGAQATNKPGRGGLIPLKVKSVILDPRSGQPVVILSDAREERALLIWVGREAGNAIQSELLGETHARPLTHDLLEKFIRLSDIGLERVVITRVEDGTYYSNIFIKRAGTSMAIDARPSDSIVLAQKFKIPIYCSEALFREMSVPIRPEGGEVEENYGLGLQDLTPPLREAFSFDAGGGVLVSDVKDGSRAAEDGMERGDIITEVAGQAIEGVSGFREVFKAGRPLTVRLFRKKHYLNLTMHPD